MTNFECTVHSRTIIKKIEFTTNWTTFKYKIYENYDFK
jgi:hypothetical protein